MGGYEGQAIPSEETDENEAQVLKCPVFDTKISRKNPEILTVYFVFEPVRPFIKVIFAYTHRPTASRSVARIWGFCMGISWGYIDFGSIFMNYYIGLYSRSGLIWGAEP